MCSNKNTQTDRDLAATGVKNKRAFQDFSASRCLSGAWITGENVKYAENLSKTYLKCLEPEHMLSLSMKNYYKYK